ncbi:STAS domain-containing protein [Streptomyces sp. NPDC101754]|uniref:STAS domain-containing protein n=1 Tax=Streptomyces sp. NPDC101754 TaxID=3366145 RepID=UPI0037FE4A7F
MSSGGCAGQSCVTITRLVLPGPSPTAQDAARLCDRLVLLYESGAACVVCDAGAVTAPGLGAVEALARLRLTAGGRPLRITGVGAALRALLHLVGLVELLGEPEQGEPPVGVEEGVQAHDPPL